MKRTLPLVLGAFVAVFVLAALFKQIVHRPEPGRVDAARLFAATQAYRQDLQQQGVTLPPTVNLQELLRRGLLQPDDVRGFDGVEVAISLTADESRPQEVLLRARLPKGDELVVLADGSVQQLNR
ncbi:MAG: hypothetical protein ACYDC1_18285 [Limisphaerales bacterium]